MNSAAAFDTTRLPPSRARSFGAGFTTVTVPGAELVRWYFVSVQQALNPPSLPASVDIGGERFQIDAEEGCVFLTHPQWSLVGAGRDFDAAHAALLAEARLIAEDLRDVPLAELSSEAQALRAFVLGLP